MSCNKCGGNVGKCQKSISCNASQVYALPETMDVAKRSCIGERCVEIPDYLDTKTWPDDQCCLKAPSKRCDPDYCKPPSSVPHPIKPHTKQVHPAWPEPKKPAKMIVYTGLRKDDPRKYHIPGYAGHVPNQSDKFGTFGLTTRIGMNQFKDELTLKKAVNISTAKYKI